MFIVVDLHHLFLAGLPAHSLFGWFLALRGLALLVVPHLYEKAGIEAMNAISLVRIGFSLLVLAGLWLTYTGWIAKPPRQP